MRKTWNAAKNTRRKKEGNIRPVDDMCFTCTAIHAGEREVCGYGLMDATGDSAHDAYVYGAKRMLPAGVVPITVESPFQNGCKTGLS